VGSHRAAPPRRRAEPAGRRRADRASPRYGRLAVLGASLSVTGIAMLGGVGVLPSVASGDSGGGETARDSAAGSVLAGAVTTPSATPTTEPSTQATPSAGRSKNADKDTKPPAADASDQSQDDVADADASALDPPPPEDSGDGRRIVFDQSDQRVWLVDDDNDVTRTYLVSGSLYDNLDPGAYAVYSRSEQAYGIDDSGTMSYFVRFTQGTNGAAIGFHDIPINDGDLVQTLDQLGTPQSHGCIRQVREDAIALWDFAPIGTEVDVTA
jgi:L,D-transpeptidase catalytic domain